MQCYILATFWEKVGLPLQQQGEEEEEEEWKEIQMQIEIQICTEYLYLYLCISCVYLYLYLCMSCLSVCICICISGVSVYSHRCWGSIFLNSNFLYFDPGTSAHCLIMEIICGSAGPHSIPQSGSWMQGKRFQIDFDQIFKKSGGCSREHTVIHLQERYSPIRKCIQAVWAWSFRQMVDLEKQTKS